MIQLPSVFDVSPDASSIATRVGSTAGETRSTELMKSSRSITDYGFGSTTGSYLIGPESSVGGMRAPQLSLLLQSKHLASILGSTLGIACIKYQHQLLYC